MTRIAFDAPVTRRRLGAVAGTALVAGLVPGVTPAASADSLRAPTGPVVLTVVGDIARSNRGPFDAAADKFFGYHELSFERAATFDRAMLQGLGRHVVRVGGPVLKADYAVAGPRLADVLAAAGAAPRDVTVLALDGFRAEIPAARLAAEDWIVGIEANGRPLGLGDRGPAWILFAPRDPAGSAIHDEEMQWPWAAFALIVGDLD